MRFIAVSNGIIETVYTKIEGPLTTIECKHNTLLYFRWRFVKTPTQIRVARTGAFLCSGQVLIVTACFSATTAGCPGSSPLQGSVGQSISVPLHLYCLAVLSVKHRFPNRYGTAYLLIAKARLLFVAVEDCSDFKRGFICMHVCACTVADSVSGMGKARRTQ